MSGARREREVLLGVFVTGQLTAQLLRRELPPGMSPERFGVQSVIGALGPITPSALADRLGMAPTTVSAWLGRLEGTGVVRRSPNPADGRSSLVELTEGGRAQLRDAMPAFRHAVRRVEHALGADVAGVKESAEKLERALAAVLANTAKT